VSVNLRDVVRAQLALVAFVCLNTINNRALKFSGCLKLFAYRFDFLEDLNEAVLVDDVP